MKKSEIIESMGIDEMVAGAAEDGWPFNIWVFSEESLVGLHLPALPEVEAMTTAEGIAAAAEANVEELCSEILRWVADEAEELGIDQDDFDAWEGAQEFADDIIAEAKKASDI